jgi:glycosyltransferase involved in cell wall biosynthesis
MLFVSQSSMAASSSALKGIVSEMNRRVLYNGLDLQYYQQDPKVRESFRRRYQLGYDLLIGIACALRSRKQLEHLFEVSTSLSDLPVRIFIAGGSVSGDEAYASRIIEQAKYMLGKRFLYLGHLNDLRGFYNGLDLCINTSKEEGFSISILEALACGCPVVGYPSVAVSEAVLPGGGEIVEQDNINQLTQTVRHWLSNPDKLTAARASARKRAEHFDVCRIAEQLWNEYQDILKPCKA